MHNFLIARDASGVAERNCTLRCQLLTSTFGRSQRESTGGKGLEMNGLDAWGATELGPLVVQLTVSDAAAAVKFYCQVFDADELYRNGEADGVRIVHCELLLCGARIVVHDEFPEFGLMAPGAMGGPSTSLNLYVDDAVQVHARALAAGGVLISSPKPHFWGAVSGAFLDPFGHRWIVSTQVEDLSPDEIIRRSKHAPALSRLSAATSPSE
jgi:PhnB protein